MDKEDKSKYPKDSRWLGADGGWMIRVSYNSDGFVLEPHPPKECQNERIDKKETNAANLDRTLTELRHEIFLTVNSLHENGKALEELK